MNNDNAFHTVTDDTHPKIVFLFFVEFDDPQHLDGWLATGDDEQDRKDTDEVIRRVEGGDVWAWAYVRCTATIDNGQGVTFTGSSGLGGCCYSDAKDFLACEAENLMSEARSDLIERLKTSQAAGVVALYFRQQLSLKGIA